MIALVNVKTGEFWKKCITPDSRGGLFVTDFREATDFSGLDFGSLQTAVFLYNNINSSYGGETVMAVEIKILYEDKNAKK